MPLAKLYAAWTQEKLRAKWLPNAPIVTSATPGKYVRAKRRGDSRLAVGFYARGPEKAQVAVDHGKLANSKECMKMKSWWFAALNRREPLLTS